MHTGVRDQGFPHVGAGGWGLESGWRHPEPQPYPEPRAAVEKWARNHLLLLNPTPPEARAVGMRE